MSWAQRLKRVFNIDITECEKCEKCENHNISIIACIIDVHVIQKILKHLDKKYPTSTTTLLPPLRAPPNEQYGNDFTVQRDFNFGAYAPFTAARVKKNASKWWGHLRFNYPFPVPRPYLRMKL